MKAMPTPHQSLASTASEKTRNLPMKPAVSGTPASAASKHGEGEGELRVGFSEAVEVA